MTYCDNWRVCDNCESPFQEGWTIGETNYYCSEKCMDSHGIVTYKQFLESYTDEGDSYWSSWADQEECTTGCCEEIE